MKCLGMIFYIKDYLTPFCRRKLCLDARIFQNQQNARLNLSTVSLLGQMEEHLFVF
jgi:hypothetical protein